MIPLKGMNPEFTEQEILQFLPHALQTAHAWKTSSDVLIHLFTDDFRLHELQQEHLNMVKEKTPVVAERIEALRQTATMADEWVTEIAASTPKPDIPIQTFEQKIGEYQELLVKLLKECHGVSINILQAFFLLEIDEQKYPELKRFKEILAH